MTTVEREYDLSQSTYGSDGGGSPLDGSGGREEAESSGCMGPLIWALIIYGVAILLAIFIPGAGNFWGMVIGAESEGVNWVRESSEVRLLVFFIMLVLLSPADWWGALIAFLVGTILTIVGWWILPADVWGLPFPDWYVNNSVGMYWLLWIAALARSLARL